MEILTVSQLTREIRDLLEREIGDLWVEGEVSNHRKQSSGHQYFTLRDSRAQLSCVFFRGHAWNSRVNIQDGAKVRLSGELSVYEARGQYQLVVKQVRPIGVGNLHERFEALKLKLRQEGLFDGDRKRELPAFPERLAVITSPTGAVIRDLLSVLERRAPWVEVVIYPARVQGEGAYLEVVEGLDVLGGRTDIDAIILARGGGNLEDLWAFNEEALARAIAACPHPVVSAVGHETDFTIADFVADVRAPTPSAAAELTTPDQQELRQLLRERGRQFGQLVRRRLHYLDERLGWLRRGGILERPRRYMAELTQRLDELALGLENSVESGLRRRVEDLFGRERALRILSPAGPLQRLEERLMAQGVRLAQEVDRQIANQADRLAATERHLRALGPEQTLARGYSMVLDENRRPISSIRWLPAGRSVRLRVLDGEVGVTVGEEQ